MKKLGLAFGAMFLLLLLFLPLLVALTTARTGMIQAEANAAQATANTIQATTTLVSQCLTGLMVFTALGSGMVLGYGLPRWRSKHTSARAVGRKWLPGPHAQWKQQPDVHPAYLFPPHTPHSGGYTQSIPTPAHPLPLVTMTDLEVDPDGAEVFLGTSWGF